ncbi:MAG: response regulator [Planctomycetes bacterium]|nr:response regulator [Planctomycetota bacterium]
MSEARILVVDDEAEVCELVADWLAEEGEWVVDYTTEPLRALEQVGQATYDLMVTDLCMPEMHGLDLARQARGLCPNLSVIGITGYASLDSSVDALRQGFVDYIQKPFRVDDLRTAVYRALANRSEQSHGESAADEVTHDNAVLAAANDDLNKRLQLVSRELTAMQQRLAGQVANMEIRCTAADQLDGQRDPQQILGMGLVMLREQLPAEEHVIVLLQKQPPQMTALATIEDEEIVIRCQQRQLARGVLRAVLKRGMPALIEDLSDSPVLGDVEQWITAQGSLLLLPLIGNSRTQAIALVRRSETGTAFTIVETRRALAVCGELGKAIEIAKTIGHQQGEVFACLKQMADSTEGDGPMAGHARRVTQLARDIARRLSLDEGRVQVLEVAARLHDIGKVLLPPEVRSRNGRLSDEEMVLWQSHAERGWAMLRPLGFLEEAVELIHYHHNPEQWDADAPLEQQILAASEAYDELTHDGVHGVGLAHDDAMAAVRALYDDAVDADVLGILNQCAALSQ